MKFNIKETQQANQEQWNISTRMPIGKNEGFTAWYSVCDEESGMWGAG